MSFWSIAAADIATTGAVNPDPTGGTVNGTLFVGNAATGSLTIDTLNNSNGNSTLTANTLSVGNNGTGNGTVTLDGTGVIVNLLGPPNQSVINNPLEVGQWGIGLVTVKNGAVVNGLNPPGSVPANCISSNCNVFIGQTAGSSGTLTLMGAGTSVSLGGNFIVGNASVFSVAAGDGFNFGNAGGTATGAVNVQSGATLNTYNVNAGQIPVRAAANGNEHAVANLSVQGAGSVWNITQNPVNLNQAVINLATHQRATATLDITNSGKMVITGGSLGSATNLPGLNTGAGTSTINVHTGGALVLANGTGFINVGASGGTSTLDVASGGQVHGTSPGGLIFMNVGRQGANGTLNIDGANSSVTLSGVAGAGTGFDNAGAFMTVGRDSGSVGHVNVTNGALLYINDGGQAANSGSTGLRLGRDANSTGIMTVSGLNTQVIVEQTGSGTSLPSIFVGQAGTGQMTITDHATVSVNGPSERDVIVGNASGGNGTLVVSNGAQLTASWFTTGNNGGTGTSTIDNATVLLNGLALNTPNPDFGASVRVGRGAGSTGTLNLVNGAQIIIDTATDAPAINLGGTGTALGGSGTLHMSGGSSISFVGTAAAPSVSIGHSGFGLFTIDDSTLTLPDDGTIVLANRAAGNGTLQIGGASTIDTGFVIVGNSGQGAVVMTGGTLRIHGSQDPDAFVFGFNSGGVGTFAQSGGVVTVDFGTTIGLEAGSSGTYTLSGGTLNSGNTTIGERGSGSFTISSSVGAIHNVSGDLTIAGTASSSSYTITGNGAQTNVNFRPGGLGPTNPPGLNGVDSSTGLQRPAPNGGLGVGVFGTGTFTQGAANFSDPGNTVNVAGDLVVGVFPGATGTYTLNTGTLTVGGKLVIGGQSQGNNVFTQNGGSVTVTGTASGNPDYIGLGGQDFVGSLTVGGGINDLGGGTGKYVMTGGTVTASLVQVGLSGTGTFQQSGGTVTTDNLWLGNCGGCNGGNASGTYTLTGTGIINASSEAIGLFGHGEFTQNGAATRNNVSGALLVGDTPKIEPDVTAPNRSGSYTLMAGELHTQETVVGSQGRGSFTQSGGLHAVAGNLTIGRDNPTQSGNSGGPSNGTYSQTGGLVTVGGNLIVGDAGKGTFTQSGSTNTIGGQFILGNQATGDGKYAASSGAAIVLTGSSAAAVVVVGNQGTGLLTMIGGSTLTLPSDGQVIVAATSGSVGQVELQSNSSIQAGSLFGIGHNGTTSTGGNASVYLDSGSSITATNIYIGAAGCLGGNGGIVHGNLVMDGPTSILGCSPPTLPVGATFIDPLGILHPGRSPGVITIDGGFDFISGTIELEIASDGHGGFLTDEIIFTNGTIPNLALAHIEFSFLGDANPDLFAPLWNLDTFLKTIVAGGSLAGISALGGAVSFADATFAAVSDSYVFTEFSFDPDAPAGESGATFVAVPAAATIAEPGTLALLLVATALLMLGARKQRYHAFAGRA